ncbi:hypothetical protein MRX96_024643 [Rhipicephalus microplus]
MDWFIQDLLEEWLTVDWYTLDWNQWTVPVGPTLEAIIVAVLSAASFVQCLLRPTAPPKDVMHRCPNCNKISTVARREV